ncbi:MAG: hypothetical protein AB1451_01530 [Nitrospirota bacterium]
MDTIRKVDYFAMDVPQKVGEGARVLNLVRDAGLNLLAFTGFPSGRKAQIDFIPEDPGAFLAMAKRARLRVRAKKAGFLVQGDDHPGAIANLMSRLAQAKINVTAIDAVCAGQGRYGAIFWVKPGDVKKAATTLGVVQ